MKIAISATGTTLDATVDPRFGRCQSFLLVETDDMRFEAIDNGNSELGGGAGIQTARMIVETGAEAVLTGNCGPNAHQTLCAAGIDVITGCSGAVFDVVARFVAGQLRPPGGPNVDRHAGMGNRNS